MSDTKVTPDSRAEYIAGLRNIVDLIEANPHIAEMFAYALRNIQEPNLTYDELDSLAEVGAAAGADVSETLDDRWRNVTIAFGPVKMRGYGPIQHDPNQPCPTCGTCTPAAKPLVSDEAIAEAEQISRLVAPMDLGLPMAECGCPIWGTVVDHCAACASKPEHFAVSDSRCSCGWEVDGFTAPELAQWKLNMHIADKAVQP